jgi:hypothetical protein
MWTADCFGHKIWFVKIVWTRYRNGLIALVIKKMVRADKFGLVLDLYPNCSIFAHSKNSEVTIMVHVVISADSDAGGISSQLWIGFVFPKMPSLNVLRLIVKV